MIVLGKKGAGRPSAGGVKQPSRASREGPGAPPELQRQGRPPPSSNRVGSSATGPAEAHRAHQQNKRDQDSRLIVPPVIKIVQIHIKHSIVVSTLLHARWRNQRKWALLRLCLFCLFSRFSRLQRGDSRARRFPVLADNAAARWLPHRRASL